MSLPVPLPIDAVPVGEARPLWSVMIPTFNCANYLRQTLQSVLAQDPGADKMQIEVIDDCSTKDDPEAVVREVGGGRVLFHRKEQNAGAIANFNTCIQRSRGQLVHILHGDDYVLPGFYAKIEEVSTLYPNLAGYFVRCLVVDEESKLESISGRLEALTLPTRTVGDLFYTNGFYTPGVVVRRNFYEQHGGFLPHLIHTADWEMWVRVVAKGGGIWLNELLAAYREFGGNDTGRLTRTAENLRDFLRAGEVFTAAYDDFDREYFTGIVTGRAFHQENMFRDKGNAEAAVANYKLWCELTPFHQRWKGHVRRLMAYKKRRNRAGVKTTGG